MPLRAAVLGSALALVVSAGLWWTNRGDGRLHLIAPVIPGDGFLLKSPGGQVALIDGGADGSAVASWLGGELPLGQRQIDLLLPTRADTTTLPGQLAAVRRYRIEEAVLVQPVDRQPLWDELVRMLAEQGTPVHIVRDGDRFGLAGARGQPAAVLRIITAVDGRLTLELVVGPSRLLLLQSLSDQQLPATIGREPVAAIIYPWRRSPIDPVLQALTPEVIVFGEQPGSDPHLTLAERRVGSARLLHEALHGRIDLQFDSAGIHIAVAIEPRN